MPVTANNEVTTTELQQSIFNAPPSALAGLPPKVSATAPKGADTGPNRVDGDEGVPQGVKRRRDDESDDEGAPMEEGDSDAPMEASSDDDSS